MKKQLKNGVQTKSNFTKENSERSTSKESNRQKSEGRDWSKRGGAITEAIFAIQQIENYLDCLRIKGPEKIGDDYNSHFPEAHNLPRQIWRNRIRQLEEFVCDEIFAATLAYEDAVFPSTETKEEEK